MNENNEKGSINCKKPDIEPINKSTETLNVTQISNETEDLATCDGLYTSNLIESKNVTELKSVEESQNIEEFENVEKSKAVTGIKNLTGSKNVTGLRNVVGSKNVIKPKNGTGHFKVPSIHSLVCRICQANSNTIQEPLISPCNCKGTLAHVHLSCLERWLNETSRNYCELCMFRFNATQTQRYSLCQSIRMWIRHPRNRTHVQSDMLISVLLTIVTAGLITVCLLGMQYFILEGSKLGISQSWTRSAISMFLTVIVIGYLITLYLLIKDQVVPWYNWWKNTVDVRLLLSPSVTRTMRRQYRETNV